MGSRLFLVRHGETDWNASLRFQGQSDIGLTELGKEQAEKLSKVLAKEKIAAIYSSDLMRALDTAKILAADHDLEIIKVPELREINFGIWEGLTGDEIKENYGDLYMQWRNNTANVTIPEGESLATVAQRTVGAIRHLVQRHDREQALVVTHGGVIRCIVASVLRMDLNHFWRLRFDNTSVTVIDYLDKGRETVVQLNNCTHLDCNWPQ